MDGQFIPLYAQQLYLFVKVVHLLLVVLLFDEKLIVFLLKVNLRLLLGLDMVLLPLDQQLALLVVKSQHFDLLVILFLYGEDLFPRLFDALHQAIFLVDCSVVLVVEILAILQHLP